MRPLITFFSTCLLLLTLGCSSGVSVNQDYDTAADFSSFKTFAWVAQPTMAIGDAQAAQQVNSLLDKRITNAVSAELTAKGMSLDTENPDLLLAYHTGLQDKVNVTNYGYGYPRGWGAGGMYGGGGVDVNQYTEGTLIVDFIDASDKELVWRGTAQKALSSTSQTPEQATEMINKVVTQLLAQYPPK